MSCSAATGFEFEGVEKKLEITFRSVEDKADSLGLRSITQENWVELLKLIKCSILGVTKTEHFDAYVLSESSLFVYPSKVLLKTCGTTRTLLCLDYLLELSRSCGLESEFVFFSRKNFKNPQHQHFPHTSFDVEVEYLNRYFRGEGYTFGSSSSDHWNLYIADHTDSNRRSTSRSYSDKTIEIMMTHLDRKKMKQFYKQANSHLSDKEVTKACGVADIFPGAITDEFMFDPCGYSVNGMVGESYFTIHVTPEDSCSFVSFETNAPASSYPKLVDHILEIFRPGKVQISLFVDTHRQAHGCSLTHLGKEVSNYTMKTRSFYEFEHYNVAVANYINPKIS